MSSTDSAGQPSAEQTRRWIQRQAKEIEELCQQAASAEEFFPQFLQKVVASLAAGGGVIWLLGADGALTAAFQQDFDPILLSGEAEAGNEHRRLLAEAIQQQSTTAIPCRLPAEEEEGPVRHGLLLLGPLLTSDGPQGLIEVMQRPVEDESVQRGYKVFLAQMCSLASEWFTQRKLRTLTDGQSLWRRTLEFSEAVHRSLDLKSTAYAICNEGRRLIGCDRVSLAILHGPKAKVEAISGQDTLENRSNNVAALNKLATRVAAVGEPLWYSGEDADLPPELEEAIHQYVDVSFGKSVVVLPLHAPKPAAAAGDRPEAREQAKGKVVGVLVVEQIEEVSARPALEPLVEVVAQHGATSLTNSLSHNRLFLMPLWRGLGAMRQAFVGKTLRKTLAIAILLLLGAIALVAVPAELTLQAEGTIQPSRRKNVFADAQGKIAALHVDTGSPVEKGKVLAELENPDIALELSQLESELAAAEADRMRIETSWLNRKSLDDSEKSRLEAERGRIRVRIAGLLKQIRLMQEKQKLLQVRSPLAGQVITWDLRKQLAGRPVSPGQLLMTIADASSPRQLEVYLPENSLGHLANARMKAKEKNEQVTASFVLASHPGDQREGTVAEIEEAAELHEEYGHSVRLVIKPNDDSFPVPPKAGTSATVKVNCGQYPIGYVWFHQAIEFVQRRVLF